MDHYPGEHTAPVPWYGHPDAWYGQPDPWFGQPLPASWEDEAARPPARPRPASKAPARAGRQRGKPEPAPRPRQKAKAGRPSEPGSKPRAQGAPAAKVRREAKEAEGRPAPKARPAAKSRPATPDTRAAAPKVPKAPAGRGNPPRPAVRATGAGTGTGRPRAGTGARPAVRRHQQPPPLRLTRRGRRVAGVAVGALVVTGLVLTFDGFLGSGGPPQPSAASAALAGSAGGAGSGIKAPPPLPPAQPTRVRIPSIGVDAPLMNVGLDKDGVIETPPPEEKNEAAWYKDSVSPGARGASVIVGHVDNMSGPAVFYSLGALKKGSTIEVARDDGTTAVFTIFGIEVFNRTGFPAHRVYGDTKDPELRVITCGGTYSSASGYSGNVVVFARMSKTRSAADEKAAKAEKAEGAEKARKTESPGTTDGPDKPDNPGKSVTTGEASPTATPGKEEKAPAG